MTREEAIAKAKEFTERLLAKGLKVETDFEKDYVRRLLFEANFNEWLRLRTIDEDTEEAEDARYERENECADLVLMSPAVFDWHPHGDDGGHGSCEHQARYLAFRSQASGTTR